MGLKQRLQRRQTVIFYFYCFMCLLTDGSPVVQCLVKVFTHHAHEDHIEELFLKVSLSRGT